MPIPNQDRLREIFRELNKAYRDKCSKEAKETGLWLATKPVKREITLFSPAASFVLPHIKSILGPYYQRSQFIHSFQPLIDAIAGYEIAKLRPKDNIAPDTPATSPFVTLSQQLNEHMHLSKLNLVGYIQDHGVGGGYVSCGSVRPRISETFNKCVNQRHAAKKLLAFSHAYMEQAGSGWESCPPVNNALYFAPFKLPHLKKALQLMADMAIAARSDPAMSAQDREHWKAATSMVTLHDQKPPGEKMRALFLPK